MHYLVIVGYLLDFLGVYFWFLEFIFGLFQFLIFGELSSWIFLDTFNSDFRGSIIMKNHFLELYVKSLTIKGVSVSLGAN